MELWCYILRHSRFEPMTSHLRIHQPLPKYLQTINALNVAGLPPWRQLDKISARLSGLSHSAAPSAFSIRCQPCDTSSIFTDCRFQRSRREKIFYSGGKTRIFATPRPIANKDFAAGGKSEGGGRGQIPRGHAPLAAPAGRRGQGGGGATAPAADAQRRLRAKRSTIALNSFFSISTIEARPWRWRWRRDGLNWKELQNQNYLSKLE